MTDERKRILQMLEEGKIDVDEANDLLSTLEGKNNVEKKKNHSKAKSIKILVEENGKEQVNISIPMVIAKSFMKFIPKSAQKSLNKQNIDVEEIFNSIDSESNGGTLVDINDGKDHVVIKVE
ncbi:MAG: SHOCT-like domain-containing protein [Bacillota bacterium]